MTRNEHGTNTETFTLPLGEGQTVRARIYPADEPRAHVTVVLAHGAGAPQTHPFIVSFATGLAARGLDVVTFNFPYMDAKRKLPDPGAALEACYADVVRRVRAMPELDGNRLVIGGKSMGGRIASQVVARDPATAAAITALVFLGYPLHPPQKPAQLRSRHLPEVRKPMLFVQGSRDAFGTPDELAPILSALTPRPDLLPVEGGDHSFSVPKAAGISQPDLFARIQDAIATWIQKQS